MVVNIADCLSTWLENSPSDSILLIDEYRTNKKFKSTIHRVTNLSGEERYSIPFFFGIDYDATVSVLENHTSIDNPPCTAPFKAGEVCDKLNCYLLRQLLTIHPPSGSVIKLLMPMFLSKAKYASHWHPQYISENITGSEKEDWYIQVLVTRHDPGVYHLLLACYSKILRNLLNLMHGDVRNMKS